MSTFRHSSNSASQSYSWNHRVIWNQSWNRSWNQPRDLLLPQHSAKASALALECQMLKAPGSVLSLNHRMSEGKDKALGCHVKRLSGSTMGEVKSGFVVLNGWVGGVGQRQQSSRICMWLSGKALSCFLWGKTRWWHQELLPGFTVSWHRVQWMIVQQEYHSLCRWTYTRRLSWLGN